jgi:hypothetical protein
VPARSLDLVPHSAGSGRGSPQERKACDVKGRVGSRSLSAEGGSAYGRQTAGYGASEGLLRLLRVLAMTAFFVSYLVLDLTNLSGVAPYRTSNELKGAGRLTHGLCANRVRKNELVV